MKFYLYDDDAACQAHPNQQAGNLIQTDLVAITGSSVLAPPFTITTANIATGEFGYVACLVNAAGDDVVCGDCEFWPVEPGDDEWCSPGFWRNAQDAAWTPTGIARTADYNTEMTARCGAGNYPASVNSGPPPPICAGLTNTPTLQEVLDHPQCYGGDAFNAVGDLLADAHPAIGFSLGAPGSCTFSGGVEPHTCTIDHFGNVKP